MNNTSTAVWELPYGKGRKWGASTPAIVDGILGGWRVTGINTMTSGQPVNITYSPTAAGQVSGAPSYRPEYVGGDIYPSTKTPTAWFNKAAFVTPTIASPFGSLGRNVGRTEPIFNFDLGLHKEFRMKREGTNIQFRSEFFNLFNMTNLGGPAQNISNANFGTITSLSSPARQIQFALKLNF